MKMRLSLDASDNHITPTISQGPRWDSVGGGLSPSWKDSVSIDIMLSSPNIIDTHISRD